MTQAFYTMPAPHRTAFRDAVASVRDSHPGTASAEQAFLALDVDRQTVERTHTLELHARVADRLALTPEADREAIKAVLFGEAVPDVKKAPAGTGTPAVASFWGVIDG